MPVMKQDFTSCSKALRRGSASENETRMSSMSPLSVHDSRCTSCDGTDARMLYSCFLSDPIRDDSTARTKPLVAARLERDVREFVCRDQCAPHQDVGILLFFMPAHVLAQRRVKSRQAPIKRSLSITSPPGSRTQALSFVCPNSSQCTPKRMVLSGNAVASISTRSARCTW